MTGILNRRTFFWGLGLLLLLLLGAGEAMAQMPNMPTIQMPEISINGAPVEEKAKMSTYLQLMFFLTILTLAPYILVMSTAFIRIVITISFLRTALGTQQVPPTQVLMGLALFLTMFVMAPVGMKMNRTAIQPYFAGDIEQGEFLTKLLAPPREFMLRQTRGTDIDLFLELAQIRNKPKTADDIPIYVLLPSFVLSEIKTAFQIGFLLYLPFLVIDMIVSSVLMSMGMFMLSPMTISLPFKLLMFVLIDGWELVIKGVVKSFNPIDPSP
ncbi:MAG TPA: flagellar type III secretion system pore protein FliP [Phycisphaerales bacterium]|nr:flagellar type III secretion system pore protein FliP [Phycisphaerales bacterium]